MRAPSRRRNADDVEQGAAELADRGHQDADRSANQRYHRLISRAVAEQGQTTFSSREALYEKARAAQIAALQKYEPPLAEDSFDRECLALEQAIDRVEQESASQRRSGPHLAGNGSELTLAEEAHAFGAAAAIQGQASIGKRPQSFRSKIERGLLLVVALLALALSPLIFFRGIWITDTAVSYLAWPVKMLTERPPVLVTYQVVYSDGGVQKVNVFSDEIERWVSISNMQNATKPYRIVRVIDPAGRIVWG